MLLAARAEHFKAQGTGNRDGLDEADFNLIAEAKGEVVAIADQGMLVLDVVIVVILEGGGGDKAVGSGFTEANKQSGAGHA